MLPVKYANEWKIVSIVQIAFFAIILIIFLGGLLLRLSSVDTHLRKTMLVVAIFFCLFSGFKIGGGVCACIVVGKDKPSTGLVIATYILDTTSLGFLLKVVVNFMDFMLFPRADEDANYGGLIGPLVRLFGNNSNHPGPVKFDNESNKYSEPNYSEHQTISSDEIGRFHPFRITTLVILAAIICSIVAALSISDGKSSGDSASLFKAASLLFLAALILLAVILAYIHAKHSRFRTGTALILFSLIFYFVRVIYTIVLAFSGISVSSTGFNKYTLMFGDYKYYTFLAFMMESFIAIMITVISQWFLTRNPTSNVF